MTDKARSFILIILLVGCYAFLLAIRNFGAQGPLNVWRSSGPDFQIFTLAVDPSNRNIIYAGSSEGLFKSLDTGATWVSNINHPMGYAFDISIDHSDPRTIYSASDGAFKSTDGGASWTGFLGAPGATRIQVSPTDPNLVVAADTRTFRTFLSTDGGASWQTHQPPPAFKYGDAIKIDPQDPRRIYAAYVDGAFIYLLRSNNAGATWTAFDYCPSDPCQPGELYSSYTSGFAIDPTNPNITFSSAFTGAIGSPAYNLFTSLDGGANWTRGGSLPGYATAMEVSKGRPRVIYIATGGRVYRSLNDGADWQLFNNGLPQNSVSDLGFDRSGRFLHAATLNGVFSVRVKADTPFDFDGDGRTDFSVYRPSNGTWYVARSLTGDMHVRTFQSEAIYPADYDADGKTDFATCDYWNPVGNSAPLIILQSSTNTISSRQCLSGDLGFAADFDGNGRSDFAAWEMGMWQIGLHENGSPYTQQWGMPGDKPVPADYDGDGRAELAIFRPSEGKWYIANIATGATSVISWGSDGDIPVPGDYNGDGRADYAVYRPSNNTWYRLHSNDYSIQTAQWGQSGDMVTPGDYDGDGRMDAAVFRPSEGKWYVLTAANAIFISSFGQAGDMPTPSAFLY
jgi:photosystem II stability/assembly factor-like uncharacterized protein